MMNSKIIVSEDINTLLKTDILQVVFHGDRYRLCDIEIYSKNMNYCQRALTAVIMNTVHQMYVKYRERVKRLKAKHERESNWAKDEFDPI